MAKCPVCGAENPTLMKTWKYNGFAVKAYTCAGCQARFREYYDKDGRLSFVLKLERGRYVKA